MCNTAAVECSDGEKRLVPDVRPVDSRESRQIEVVREGRLEICFQGVWGAVYDANWTAIDAAVTCQEFGFAPKGMLELKWVYCN